MTPCEPELQTTALGARFSLGLWATLTPRRLVFMPRVATSQDCAARPVPVNRKSRRTGKLEALAFLIRLPAPRRLIHEDRAAFHHENDATDRGDVLEGIAVEGNDVGVQAGSQRTDAIPEPERLRDRKSTRLNSSHQIISYAVFCLKKKRQHKQPTTNDETLNAT